MCQDDWFRFYVLFCFVLDTEPQYVQSDLEFVFAFLTLHGARMAGMLTASLAEGIVV